MVVAVNIKRLREEQNLSRPDLARRIGTLEQPAEYTGWNLSPSRINALAVTRIEDGERRVDADDLVLFAAALGVSPATLLMPYSPSPVKVPTPKGTSFSGAYWAWLTARQMLTTAPAVDPTDEQLRESRRFFVDALPPWSRDLDRIPAASERLIGLLDAPDTNDDGEHN